MTVSQLSAPLFQQTLIHGLSKLNDIILYHYRDVSSWQLQHKADDSPITRADIASHDFLNELLGQLLPGCPIISEEGTPPPLQERNWDSYWMVDPLDGTSEFIRQTGAFTVNVCFIHDGIPVVGALAVPVQQKIYFGVMGQGVYRVDCQAKALKHWAELKSSNTIPSTLTIASSHRNNTRSFSEFSQSLIETVEPIQAVTSKALGSAFKFCEMLEARAHLYARFSPVCEWDVAAGHALLNSFGGGVINMQGEPLTYNQRDCFNEVYFLAATNQPLLEASIKPWQASLSI